MPKSNKQKKKQNRKSEKNSEKKEISCQFLKSYCK